MAQLSNNYSQALTELAYYWSYKFGMVNKLQEIMGWEFFCVVGFDLGPLLQGQTRIAKLKKCL